MKRHFDIVTPVLNSTVRGLCCKPYYNHPKGCPNFNKKQGCPPQSPFWQEVYHLGAKVYAIWNCFDLAEHMERMKIKHPNWSQYQLKCCLYWQPKARKELRATIDIFKMEHPNFTVTTCPEAMGINITDTMKSIGIELEWPPETKTYQVALASCTWETGISS